MRRCNKSIIPANYRPEIDGMRGLAVLAVIVNHFNPAMLPCGFLGVDIFFVISGFVISLSLYDKSDQSWKEYLLTFYVRRIKRIVPALITCVVITSLVGSLVIFPKAVGLKVSIKTAIAALGAVSNLFLLKQSADYFGSSAELNLFTHTWSLGVEEQFYLVFPLILGVCGFSRRKTSVGIRNATTIVACLSTISLISYIYCAQLNPIYSFYLMPLRFWELGLGCITFMFFQRINSIYSEFIKRLVSIILLILLIGVLFLSKDFQIFATIAVCAFSCATILVINQAGILRSRYLVKIGQISYSLYLWHWSVLVISRWTIGISRDTVAYQLILIFLLAFVSYCWIEKPLRYAIWSINKVYSIGYGLGALLISAFFLTVLGTYFKGKIYLGHIPDALSPHTAYSTILGQCQFDLPKVDSNYMARCGFINNEIFQGSSDIKSPRIFLLGDSHARVMLDFIENYTKERKYHFAFSFGASCPIPSLSKDLNLECLSSSNAIEEVLFDIVKPGDLVVISNSFEGYGLTTRDENYHDKVDYARKELDVFAKKLARMNANLLIFGIKPRFWNTLDSTLCIPEWFKSKYYQSLNCVREKTIELTQRSFLVEALTRIQLENVNVTVINLFDYFCPGKYCLVYDNKTNELLYRDSHHISNFSFVRRRIEFDQILNSNFKKE